MIVPHLSVSYIDSYIDRYGEYGFVRRSGCGSPLCAHRTPDSVIKPFKRDSRKEIHGVGGSSRPFALRRTARYGVRGGLGSVLWCR